MLSICCRIAATRICGSSFSLNFKRSPFSVSAASRASIPGRPGRPRVGKLALAGLLSSSGYIFWRTSRPSAEDVLDDAGQSPQRVRRPQASLGELIRTYIVYSMCSIPALVDHSPTILSTLSSIPIVKNATEAVVRMTFFTQFVGGDSALGTVPLLGRLRAENKGVLFSYSVEVDENEAAGKTKAHGPEADRVRPVHKHLIEETIHCIDVAANFEDQRKSSTTAGGRRTWVAIKLTALLPDAQALINFSQYLVDTRLSSGRPVCFPGSPRPSDFDVLDMDPVHLPETCPLSREDINTLREMRADLFRVCQRAKERGVKIIIDAEHSWYQPAIDAYQRSLMAEFNRLPARSRQPSILSRFVPKRFLHSIATEGTREQGNIVVQPLVYGSFQAYLRRTPEHLQQSRLDAEQGDYALGVKLVRGAYHPLEISAHETRRTVNSSENAAVNDVSVPSSPSISPEKKPPVWEQKEDTDANYNALARLLIKHVADDIKEADAVKGGRSSISKIGLLFGTHNRESCDLILDALVEEGLAMRRHEEGTDIVCIADEAVERIALGQLYGTRDELTNSLVERTRSSDPFVIKYVPYGMLSEVMPYLARRAIENRSVLGNGVAREERQRAGREIIRRIYSFFM